MKVKDYKPKYKYIELIEMNRNGDLQSLKVHMKLYTFDEVVKKYGERNLLSAQDYEDTRTTSLNMEILYN